MPQKRKRVVQINAITNEVMAEYSGMIDAVKATGISKSQVSKCCHTGHVHCGVVTFRFIEDAKEVIKPPQDNARLGVVEVLQILKHYHNTLSYNDISKKTGYTCEELRTLYDKYKIYRCEEIETMTNRCITCGVPISEDRQICKACEEHGKKKPDFVEVVRCKDCKHYSVMESCLFHCVGFEKDDFCSYGERKEDEGK